ncbi:AraC family transcriptional regulator [Marispirochaeta sp.]|uniref:AraC family transcriptional regulator n=1 Tax=Marispirochaeta sp. TaxID=2038653 RepID=UPI0029C98F39|nr:AraC family transcriptional regulator [Marispirochaeta sp.]
MSREILLPGKNLSRWKKSNKNDTLFIMLQDRRDSVDFNYTDHESGVAVMSVLSSAHVFPKHSHETYYILGLIENGATYCYGPEREDSLAAPGSFFVINPGQVHSGVPAAGSRVSYRMLSINAERFSALAEEIEEGSPSPPEFPLTFAASPREQAQLTRTYSGIVTGINPLGRDELLYELTALLLPRAERKHPLQLPPYVRHPGLQRGAEILRGDLEEKLSLAQIAAEAGMSPYHFIRSFKRAYGLSPHVYRTQQRIGIAKKLLRSGNSLADTALALGFYDQSHFSNTFRAYTGLSPSAYRKGTGS